MCGKGNSGDNEDGGRGIIQDIEHDGRGVWQTGDSPRVTGWRGPVWMRKLGVMCGIISSDSGKEDKDPITQMRQDWYGKDGGFWNECGFLLFHPVCWMLWMTNIKAHEESCKWRRFCEMLRVQT